MLYRNFRQKIHKQNSDKVWIEDSQTEFIQYKVLIENLDRMFINKAQIEDIEGSQT